jgi:hypothetical protein
VMSDGYVENTQQMRDDELDRYVCVAHGLARCLHSPDLTIRADGVWVRLPDSLNPGSYVYSSAHRDCYEAGHAGVTGSLQRLGHDHRYRQAARDL